MPSLSFDDRLHRLLWRLVPKGGLSRIMGHDLGIFHMGSTVLSVFSPGRIELYPVCSGQLVRVGQAIGRDLMGQQDLAGSVGP